MDSSEIDKNEFLNNSSMVHSFYFPSFDTDKKGLNLIASEYLFSLFPKAFDGINNITKLSGGITNILYLVENIQSKQKLIIRIFGEGTSQFISRDIENIVFSQLSLRGIGPVFYGLFANGRLEGYIDAKPVLPPQMSEIDLIPAIASSIATLHSQQIPEIQPEIPIVWNKTKLFFDLTKSSDTQVLEYLELDQMIKEFEWLQNSLLSIISNIEISPENKFAFDICLCHNDLLSGNILLHNKYNHYDGNSNNEDGLSGLIIEDKITLIDYEYAGYNYRAFDIANYFCECAGFQCEYSTKFPNKETRKYFLENYINSYFSNNEGYQAGHTKEKSPSDSFLNHVDEIVCKFTLCSHLFWGTWAIVQSQNSKIDFDYIKYARLRYEGYWSHKKQFFSS
eukprot:gene7429-10125_t